nr:MAG TPA: ribonucleoside-diphosphate reductase, adenosylcobalamin-dependent [Caudoviricetes sp.]
MDIEVCVTALNDVMREGRDLHPLEKQKQVIDDYRQIGLGVTGLADTFIKMNMKYGDKDSLDLCNKIWNLMLNTAVQTSAIYGYYNKLETFKGFSYDKFIKSDMYELLDWDTLRMVEQFGMYNSQLLTVPPAGSISILLDCSSGIEPNFEWYYKRKVESMYPEPTIIDCKAGIVREYEKAEPGVRMTDAFVTAHQVNYLDKIEVQGTIQNYIDGSISSTVNLPHDTTVDDVYNLYVTAWRKGLKGITVYRDRCEREGVLTTKDTKKKEEPVTPTVQAEASFPVQLQRGEKKPIADDTVYYKREVKIGCGELNLFIGWSEKEQALQDYWVKRKGKGGCECNIETTVISMSLLQRVGASYEILRDGFNGVRDCNSFTRARAKGKLLSKGTNCGQAIFNTIEYFEHEMKGHITPVKAPMKQPPFKMEFEAKTEEEITESYARSKCPECGDFLHREGGCYSCSSCGYTMCN